MNPLVQNSNSLLEDLRRLNQLKDNCNQDVSDTVNTGQDKTVQPKSLIELARLKR